MIGDLFGQLFPHLGDQGPPASRRAGAHDLRSAAWAPTGEELSA